MTTVSAHLKRMHQFTGSLQRMSRVVEKTILAVNQFMRVMDEPDSATTDLLLAAEAQVHVSVFKQQALDEVRALRTEISNTVGQVKFSSTVEMPPIQELTSIISNSLDGASTFVTASLAFETASAYQEFHDFTTHLGSMPVSIRTTLDETGALADMQRIKQLFHSKGPISIDLIFNKDAIVKVFNQIQQRSPQKFLVMLNSTEAVKQAKLLKTQIQRELHGVQAKIRVELPASVTVMFTQIQRLVLKLIAATKRLKDAASNQFSTASLKPKAPIPHISGQVNLDSNTATKDSGGWLSNLRGIEAAYLSIQGLSAAITISDNYVNTLTRLDLVNDKMQTTEELQDKIFRAAERSRTSYSNMAGVISQMSLASGSFKSNDELIAFSELTQKTFRAGGSSTMEQQAGMSQISQAMVDGEMQGGDFSTIMKDAPMLVDAIVSFTGKSKEELLKLSAEGYITADIIKGSVFSMADEINAKLDNMPLTFGDVFSHLKNYALKEFSPVIEKMNEMLNSDRGKQFVADIQTAISAAKTVINGLLTSVSNVYSFFSNNWSFIAPIIMGIVTAITLYKTAMAAASTWTGIVSAAQLIYAGAKAVMTGATLAATSGTAAQTAAQWGLNAAMMASPITWIILAIIVLIAMVYLIVAAINHFAGTSISATGLIAGAFAVLFATIWNIVVGVINAIIQFIWTFFVEPWISIIEWILNVINGGFDSFGDAVFNLIGNIISWFLSLGKIVTKIIDAIFGSDWTSELNSLQDKVLSWGKNDKAEKAEELISREALVIPRIEYGEAWDAGYNWGDKLGASAANLFGKETKEETDYTKHLTDINTTIGGDGQPKDINNVKEVGSIKNTVDISNEDLKMMRELAEMKNIQNFVTLQPSVSFGDTHVRNESDMTTIISRITDSLQQDISTSVDAVYT